MRRDRRASPGAVLTVFQLSGGILLGLIGLVIFVLLIAGLANGIIWIVKRCRAA